MKVIFEKKNSSFASIKSYLDTFFGPFRSNSYRFRVFSDRPRIKLIFLKKNSSFANMKSYLDTHFRVAHVVLIASEDM